MTSTDELARRAGRDLRHWQPELPDGDPAATLGRALRRRRTARGAVAAVALTALVAVGAWQTAAHPNDRVETLPACPPASGTGGTDTAPSTTTPPTSTPSMTTTPPAAEVPPPTPPAATTCSAQLSGGGTYVVTFPLGWFANEAFESERACTHFGPQPIEFRDFEEDAGWASNAEVWLSPSPMPGFAPSSTWEEYLQTHESSVAPPEAQMERISTERRIVAGQPALREEFLERGLRWVRWTALLGDTVLYASAGEESMTGLSYDAQVAGLDAIVTTIRVEG